VTRRSVRGLWRELAKRAAQLYRRQSPSEKRKLLDFVVSNSTWKGGELAVSLRQPFDRLAEFAAAARKETAAGVTSDGRSGIWLRRLDSGEVESRAELARRAGVSRARVTQVMGVWRLHRPVVEHLRAMAARGEPWDVGEHEVRALVARGEVEQNRTGGRGSGRRGTERGECGRCGRPAGNLRSGRYTP